MLNKTEKQELRDVRDTLNRLLGEDDGEPKSKSVAKDKGKGKGSKAKTTGNAKQGGIAEARSKRKLIAKMLKKGKSVNAIAAELEIGYSAIAKLAKELEDK